MKRRFVPVQREEIACYVRVKKTLLEGKEEKGKVRRRDKRRRKNVIQKAN